MTDGKCMSAKSTVRVSGTATVSWTLHIHISHANDPDLVDEAVNEALRHHSLYIYLRGEDEEPVRVNVDCEEYTVEEDER